MKQTLHFQKDINKLERLGLQEEVIKYFIWMKLKQEIASRKKH